MLVAGPATGVAVEKFGPAALVQLVRVSTKGVEEVSNAVCRDVHAHPVLAGLVYGLGVEDQRCRDILDHTVVFMSA